MTLTLDGLLQIAEMRGERLEIPPPPEVAAIWERARAEGLRVSRLFTLRRPLLYRTRGTYNRETGDVWLVCDPDEVDQAVRTLLHELAHAGQKPQPPATIDADWDAESDAWRGAAALAARWGVADAFPDGWIDERIAHDDAARDWCHTAADLAGCAHPAVARAAWDALWLLASERGWDEDALAAAVHGYHDGDADGAAALQFDRTLLRGGGGWSIGFNDAEAALGPLDLGDDARTGATAWLRSALSRARNGRPVAWKIGPWGSSEDLPIRRVFIDLDDDLRLSSVVAAANEALLLTAPDAAAAASWHVYGGAGHPGEDLAPVDRLPRIYRLSVSYHRSRRVPEPEAQTEVWVLVPARRERERRAEAALQLFLLGWRRCVGLSVEPLSSGMDLLWSQQGGR